jgi:hypothetical protein
MSQLKVDTITDEAGTGSPEFPNGLATNLDGNATTATALQTARTIALSGNVTGSVGFDGSSNVTISAAVVDDSHNHVWGNIDGASVSSLAGPRFTTPSGYIEFGPANTSFAHIYTDRPAFYTNKEIQVLGARVFHDNYHPNADRLTSTTGTAPSYSVRAWVSFVGTGTVTIRAAGNVSSITDGGVGIYTVNFTTAMQDTNYSAVGIAARAASNSDIVTAIAKNDAALVYTASAVKFRLFDVQYGKHDGSIVNAIILR